MENYNMSANFYPLNEPKNGFIGSANVLIANGIRIRGISVFEKDGAYNIQFAGFGDGENRKSYVVPASKEAYAQFLSVIEKAIAEPENHFAWSSGKYFEWDETNKKFKDLEITGEAVQEPYADARFQIEIKDLCTLFGTTTQEVAKKGEKGGTFISVRPPKLDSYEKAGETVYPPVYEGWVNKYEKDGKEHKFDFGRYLDGAIVALRKDLLNRHPSLDAQIKDAAAQSAAQPEPGKDPVSKEAQR